MSQAPIMPFYTDAYLADTHHLSTAAHGAFLLILLFTWRNNGAPPKDDDRLLRQITKTTPRQWQKLKGDLSPFFDRSSGVWRQKRLEAEWLRVKEKIAANKARGAKGGETTKQRYNQLKAKHSSAANATAQLQQSMNPKPLTNVYNKAPNILKTPALDASHTLLKDPNIYLPNYHCPLSPTMRPQLEQAKREAAALLTPCPYEQASQYIARVLKHYSYRTLQEREEILADYTELLADYPADVLYAGCKQVMATYKYPAPPKIAEFHDAMTEPMRLRQATLKKLEIILKKLEG
jgi:uncharacterized protein YdaU (DUF1376 family)